MVFVQNEHPPSEEEWNEFLRVLAENRADLPKLRLLVLTTGGAPTTEQRKRLAATLGGAPMRVASISDSMKMRFVAATISLFHRDLRLFPSKDADQAYAHIGVTAEERRQIEAAIEEMKPKIAL
jgi:hypothetical protein